jgi:hypothetical protein
LVSDVRNFFLTFNGIGQDVRPTSPLRVLAGKTADK